MGFELYRYKKCNVVEMAEQINLQKAQTPGDDKSSKCYRLGCHD